MSKPLPPLSSSSSSTSSSSSSSSTSGIGFGKGISIPPLTIPKSPSSTTSTSTTTTTTTSNSSPQPPPTPNHDIRLAQLRRASVFHKDLNSMWNQAQVEGDEEVDDNLSKGNNNKNTNNKIHQ